MKELKFEVDKEVARGRYSNMAVIGHGEAEFFLDFVLALPRQTPAVVSRVITNPRHAKALLRSLEENVRRYEARYGEIAVPTAKGADEQN
jgi:hypothetical protein